MPKHRALIGIFLFLLAINLGCSTKNVRQIDRDSTSASGKEKEKEKQPGKTTAAPKGIFQGEVLETLDAGGYTYAKLAVGEQVIWTAIPTAKLQVGDRIDVKVSVVMHGFHSKSLSRDFEQIVFGTLASRGDQKKNAVPENVHEL